jgi:hypothetical protein
MFMLEQNRKIAKDRIVPMAAPLRIVHATTTWLAPWQKPGHPEIEIRGGVPLGFALTFSASGLALRASHAAYVWHPQNEVHRARSR